MREACTSVVNGKDNMLVNLNYSVVRFMSNTVVQWKKTKK